MVLDVEQILHDVIPSVREVKEDDIKVKTFKLKPGAIAIVAEDSKVARQMLEQGLKAMGIPAEMHTTGLEAWEKIKKLYREAQEEGISIHDKIALVLTDLEMPEMDGFTLTRNIKSDHNLKGLPVVIHSSLSGSANEDHVRKVGANGYVAKFEISQLSAVIHQVLEDAVY
ncbi:MAG TPA: chemotaxis protein CheV, partial [Erwinia persicina]|nr:chemotaxis protein CheV [Erwinia persicina]